MNKFEKIYNEYIEKPVLKFDDKEIDLCIKRDDFLYLLKYGKILEQDLSELQDRVDFLIDRNDEKQEVLDKIKEEIDNLGMLDCNIPNYIICITKINELLEEIK